MKEFVEKTLLNAVTATTTSPAVDVTGLSHMGFQFKRANHSSGSSAFSVEGTINGTDWTAFRASAMGDRLTHQILGVIEDIREEHAHLRQYPAAKPYLDALNNAMFVTGHYADVEDGVPPIVALTGYLAYRCWCDYRGVGSLVMHAQQAEGVDPELRSLEGMDSELAVKLAEAGIKTRDDLADLAVDDLTEISGIDVDRAKDLIMKARAHWFTE